ncbi:helix-turn-helix domain-containing protein [Nocardia sp. NPDC004123]
MARFLTHCRAQLGLTIADVADAALLPASLITTWEAGANAASSQLIRCAPALQLEEATLPNADQGRRNTGYWPLPQPKRTRLKQ